MMSLFIWLCLKVRCILGCSVRATRDFADTPSLSVLTRGQQKRNAHSYVNAAGHMQENIFKLFEDAGVKVRGCGMQ
jgi:hypothetical protein